MTLWTAVFTLFLVLDPPGNLPVVTALLKDTPAHRRRWVILRESLFALAVPLMAGPSAMAAVILMQGPSGLGPDSLWLGLGAILLAWSASTVILQLGPFLARVLGQRVLRATERPMGMLLIVISVHLLMTGMAPYLAG